MLLYLLACQGDEPAPVAPSDCDVLVVRYDDEDGDGYGDPDTRREGCDADGAEDAGDCDDGDPLVHPGAEEDCAAPVDANCDGSIGYADADGDRWAACEDCDDADAGANPAAREACDGVDDDCDGEVDEGGIGALDWYADADGDGFGDPQGALPACDAPEGRVADATDCDDTDGAVFPGAPEACDEVDADCDGDLEDGADPVVRFVDADADGWGDDAGPWVGCHPPDGYADAVGDCDDADAGTNPDATEVCDGRDEDCDGTIDDVAADGSAGYADRDGDGYGDAGAPAAACDTASVADGSDCDDADAGVSPAVSETCDGLDQDCDGLVDEDATDAPTWYADVDGDGYGDAASTAAACDVPAGYVADATDCLDGDASVHPGAVEVCDGLDDDCDGTVPADDVVVTFYADADGDGWGDPATTTDWCVAPSGYVAAGGDCDDADAAVNPAATETCATATDDDCDGDTNDRDALGCVTWYLDEDGDGFGSTSSHCTCEGAESYTATDDEDCDDADAGVNPDALDAWLNGVDDDCDGEVDVADLDDVGLELRGETNQDYAGAAVAVAGDVDGDGYADVLVGAYGSDLGGSLSGAAYVVRGPITSSSLLADATVLVWGEDAGDDLGGAVAGVGDVDGDGLDDVLVGAWGDDDGGADAGAAYLVSGPGFVGEIGSADAKLTGNERSGKVGTALAGAGDTDGDGYADLLVASDTSDANGTDAGAAWLVRGPVAGDFGLYGADARLLGESRYDAAGVSVAGGEDFDGDGLPDVAIGADGEDSEGSASGAAYVVFAPISGDLPLELADVKVTGSASLGYLGDPVALAHDHDGDGYADLLVHATNGTDDDAVYLVRGPGAATIACEDADAILVDTVGDGRFGTALGDAGDLDGDGNDDVMVGKTNGSATEGSVTVFLGPLSGTIDVTEAAGVLYAAEASDLTAVSLAAGDLDGAGGDDLVVGASGGGAGNQGAAYVVLGP